jgi:hypothetical protein
MGAEGKAANEQPVDMAPAISPWLSVRNGARAVEFCKSAFGAIEAYRVQDPAG